MKQDMANPDVIKLILALHKKDGTEPLSKLPGLWNRKLDQRWEFWINGHLQPLAREGRETQINPGDCYVEFNGWPAGIFNLITGEGTIAAGTLANYFTFCEAIDNALKEGK